MCGYIYLLSTLSIHPSIHPSIHLFIDASVLLIFRFFDRAIHLSTYLYVSLFVYVSTDPSVYLSLSVVFLALSLALSLYPSTLTMLRCECYDMI